MTKYIGQHRNSPDGEWLRTVPEQDYDVDDASELGPILLAASHEISAALNASTGYERYRMVAVEEASA